MAFALRKVLLVKNAFVSKYFKNSAIVTTTQKINPVVLCKYLNYSSLTYLSRYYKIYCPL